MTTAIDTATATDLDRVLAIAAERDGVEVAFVAPVLTITVARPERLNALSGELLDGLADVLVAIAGLPLGTIAGVVLTGAGRAFVAGADIAEMAALDPADAEAFARRGQRVPDLVEALPVPVVAVVDGHALGGGGELVLACDVVYATRAARFGQPEVTLGLIMGFGGCVRLQRAVGPARARELAFTGRIIDAELAAEWGLATAVHDDRAAALSAARDTLLAVASNSPLAVATTKRVMHEVRDQTVNNGLATERAAFRNTFASQDMREGTAAFLARRTARFVGR